MFCILCYSADFDQGKFKITGIKYENLTNLRLQHSFPNNMPLTNYSFYINGKGMNLFAKEREHFQNILASEIQRFPD